VRSPLRLSSAHLITTHSYVSYSGENTFGFEEA
jgi:hypothetical protein